MIDALGFSFFQQALLAGVFAAILCGVVGTLVVVNRIVFLAGGIAHAAYGGIGLAVFLGLPFAVGVSIVTISAAFLMAVASLKWTHQADTIIGVLWAVGMAMGIILLDITPGYQADLMSYLFGSILAVSTADIWRMTIGAVLVLALLAVFFRSFLAISYDPDFAKLRGIPVKVLYFLSVGMVALCVVLLIRVVGLILVIALFTIPPFIAEKYTQTLAGMMALSVVLSLVFTTLGLFLAYFYDLTSGAAIVLVAAGGFFIVLFTKRASLRA